MHELSVTQRILDIALQHAEQAKATRIVSINITIGQLSSILDDSVQFYWDIISHDTIAEGAKLNFNRVPSELLCLDCEQRYRTEGGDLACPTCGSTRIKVVTGLEFYLESIDVS